MTDALRQLMRSLPPGAVITDAQITGGYRRDRADIVAAGTPRAVIRPATAKDVSVALSWASAHRVPVVPRGAGHWDVRRGERDRRRCRGVAGKDDRHPRGQPAAAVRR